MSKAILILDEMPERCEDCPLKADDGYPNCVKHVGEYPIAETPTKGRQAWCPLRLMPEKQKFYPRHREADTNDEHFIFGWNRCIEAIERRQG